MCFWLISGCLVCRLSFILYSLQNSVQTNILPDKVISIHYTKTLHLANLPLYIWHVTWVSFKGMGNWGDRVFKSLYDDDFRHLESSTLAFTLTETTTLYSFSVLPRRDQPGETIWSVCENKASLSLSKHTSCTAMKNNGTGPKLTKGASQKVRISWKSQAFSF